MNCVRCLSTIEPGARFCGNCGLVVAQSAGDGAQAGRQAGPAHRLVLEIEAGPGTGQRFEIGPVSRVGRANGNEVQLFDAEVSRLHAVIYEYEQGFAIVDQNSVNGTFVNGAAISGPTWIRAGDEVLVGRSRLRVGSGAGAQAVSAGAAPQARSESRRGGLSTWLILGVLLGGGFLLLAAAVFVYFLFF